MKPKDENKIWVHLIAFTDIFVENTFGYDELYVHYWKDDVVTSGWPGIKMTAVDGKAGWFTAPVDTRANKINFTDGAAENTQHTDEMALDLDNPYYYGGAWHDGYPLVYSLTANGKTYDMTLVEGQYTVSVELENGDTVSITDNKGKVYDNYEAGCGFDGTATKTARYDFYLKMTEGNPIWVNAITFTDIYVRNDFGYEKVFVHYFNNEIGLTTEWPGIEMTAVVGHDGWFSAPVDTRATGLQFTDGAKEDTEHTDNIAINFSKVYYYGGAWDDDFTPIAYSVSVKGTPTAMTLENGEYTAEVYLQADDVVTISDNRGNTYANYEVGCGFNGTADSDGTYIFYLKVNDNNKIWVHHIQFWRVFFRNDAEFAQPYVHAFDNKTEFVQASWPGTNMTAVEGKDGWFSGFVDTRAASVIFSDNGKEANKIEVNLVADSYYYWGGAWHDDYPTTYAVYVNGTPTALALVDAQYTAQVDLHVGDEIVIKDSKNVVYDNYEVGCGFDGTVGADGAYIFYLKMTEGNPIWVHHITYRAVYVQNSFGYEHLYVHFWKDGVISSTFPGEEMSAVQDKDGWFTFSIDTRADHVLFCDGTDANKTENIALDADNVYYYDGEWHNAYPVATVYSLTVGAGDPVVMTLNGEGQYQATGIVLAVGNTVTITDNKGHTFSNYEANCQFNGAAAKAGTYSFFLKVNDENKIWVNGVTTIYAKNSFGYPSMRVHSWNNSVSYTTQWPGTEMTPVEGKYKWFKAEIDVRAAVLYFIDGTNDLNRTSEISISDYTKLYYYQTEWLAAYPDEPTTYELYYYNENAWANVYAYAWSGDIPSVTEYKGAYPGAKMTAVEGKDGWFKTSVDFFAEKVIFSDGGDVNKTSTIALDDSKPYVAAEDQIFASMPQILYYCNDPYFPHIYAYAWSGTEPNEVKYLGNWPGKHMKNVVGHDGWCFIFVDAAAEKVIFNDGANEPQQTDTIAIDPAKPYVLYGEAVADFTVYYYNTDSWASVYAYAWSGTEPNEVEFIGAWPGTAMTAVAGEEGWFKISVSPLAERVIFSNNGANEKAAVLIDFKKPYIKDGECLAAIPVEKVNVYFYNSFGCADDQVRAYAWKGESEALLGAWPGSSMTPVNGHDGWLTVLIPVTAEKIIFANGNGGEGLQTADQTLNFSKLFYKNGEWTADYPVDPDPEETMTVYYYNTNAWGSVYAYAWKGANTPKLGAWPGAQMTAVEGHDGWFKVDVPTDAESICFNNNDGAQTSDYELDPNALFCKDDYWTADYPAPWDGKIYVDFTGINWFNDGNADAYLYVWYYNPNSNNGNWPGVKMTKVSDRVYSAYIDTELNFSGLKFARCNPDLVEGDVEVWNKTAAINAIPGNHVFVITELLDANVPD